MKILNYYLKLDKTIKIDLINKSQKVFLNVIKNNWVEFFLI